MQLKRQAKLVQEVDWSHYKAAFAQWERKLWSWCLDCRYISEGVYSLYLQLLT